MDYSRAISKIIALLGAESLMNTDQQSVFKQATFLTGRLVHLRNEMAPNDVAGIQDGFHVHRDLHLEPVVRLCGIHFCNFALR